MRKERKNRQNLRSSWLSLKQERWRKRKKKKK